MILSPDRLRPRALAAVAGLGLAFGAGPGPTALVAQGGGRAEAEGACEPRHFWVLRVDGPSAIPLQALELSGRVAGASPLRHRPSRRLTALACRHDFEGEAEPATPDRPMAIPGTRRGGLTAFGTGQLAGNSGYPRGGNDGALWQGRGVAALLRPGVAGGWRFFSVSVAPELVFWQNASFKRWEAEAGTDLTFRNPWHTLDLPERPGQDAGGEIFPGQSFVRADLGPLAAGVSTANLRLGPARHYPLVLGTAGPGFPHAFAGTSGPVRLGPVALETEVFAGEARESDYYDDDPDNDRRALIGTYLGLSFAPAGLWVGVARLFSEYLTDERTLGAVFRDNALDNPTIEGSGANNNPGNGLASIFFHWAPPGTDFELYGEYGRDDYGYDTWDLIRVPDWTRAYNLGVSKLLDLGRPVMVNVELVDVALSTPERAGKGWFTVYTHSRIRHGLTHRGQMLGAWTGPGSEAQRVSVDVLAAQGLMGGYLQRVAYDEDTYYRRWAFQYAGSGHDIELTAGAHLLRSVPAGDLWAELRVSHRRNRDFAVFGADGAMSSEWNLGLEIQLLLDSD